MNNNDIKKKFVTIQKRLKGFWPTIASLNNEPHTIIVVPSLSLDPKELNKIHGIVHYEERFLFMLMLLRQPNCEIIFVSSQQIHPYIIDYYLQNLPGIPYSHAKKRLKLIAAYDNSSIPLTQKILDRPGLIKRIKRKVRDPKSAYLSTFVTTPLERELAVKLNVALYGTDPELSYIGTKSGCRKIFKKLKVNCPPGYEDIHNKGDLTRAVYNLFKANPDLKKVLVKLNDSFSGEGNAFVSRPKNENVTLKSVGESLKKIKFQSKSETASSYMKSLKTMGGIAEEVIETKEIISPSVQLRITPFGKVELLSTHDQILGGRGHQVYLGCKFPADVRYRNRIQLDSLKIGQELAKKGVIGRLSIDYIILYKMGGDEESIFAIEINLRKGGTTHPFLTLDFLVSGTYDPESGEYTSGAGAKKYYISSDNVQHEDYKGILPDDLFEISALENVYYSNVTETGVVLHLIGALSEFGKVGITCIGDSMLQAENYFEKMVDILNREAAKNKPSNL